MRALTVALLAMVLSACDAGRDGRELETRVVVARGGYTTVAINTEAQVMETGSQLQVRLLAGDDSAIPSENVSDTAIWRSSNSAVATVSDSGIVTGLTDGTVRIVGELGPLRDEVDIRVSSAELSEIRVSTDNALINECSSASFTAMGVYGGDAELRNITGLVDWSVSAASGVGVFSSTDTDGLFRSSNAGAATVTAARNGVTGSTPVTVLDNLSQITLPVPADQLTPSKSVQYLATAAFTDSEETIGITNNATWSLTSDVSGFGTIDNTLPVKGLVTASRTGSATVTAACGGLTTSLAVLSGSSTEVVDFFFDPSGNSIRRVFVGATTLQLRSFVRFEDRTASDVTEDSIWTVSSTTSSSLTLSNLSGTKGLLTIQGAGTITVQADYIDDSTDITVPYRRSIEVEIFSP